MLMEGSPPGKGALVTLANWQEAPANRWAFWHVRELLPTHRVARSTWVRPLPQAPGVPDVEGVRLIGLSGEETFVGDVLQRTHTDAVLVLQDGKVAYEWYGEYGAHDRPHLLMSVTKSIVGCVAGVLVDLGVLDPSRAVETYVPELGASGFAGATARQLLDMRSGVAFREDYTDPDAEVRELDRWVGWRPSRAGERPRGLYAFLTRLRADRPHGGTFAYRSAETDALGWVIERAAGARIADLLSELVWQPLGAEHDAEWLCDGLGTAVHNGGLNATLRDLARFGQLLLDGGRVPSRVHAPALQRARVSAPHAVLPPEWLSRAWAVDAQARAAFAGSPAEVSFPGGWYRNCFWFRPGDYGDVLLCLGIHGQMLHVSRRTRTVCVKFSSWPRPQHPDYLQETLRAFDAVGGALAGREPVAGRRGLPGVVSGLRRGGVKGGRATL